MFFHDARKFWPLLPPLSLTLLSMVSWLFSINLIGPFDARNGAEIAWLELSMPLEAQIIEPLMSLSHLVFGAPNFRTALLSIGCWLFVTVLITAINSSSNKISVRRYIRSIGIASVVVWFFLLYILFIMVHHVPGWSLASTDSSSIIIDFQSHTESSQDGIVSINKNLEWHDKVGFDVVSITEHWRINNKLGEILLDDKLNLPAVILGTEVGNENNNYLLGLGLNPQDPITGNIARNTRKFVKTVHDVHQGVVVAMTWELDEAKVDGLVDADIDAFEIVNSGHPYIYDRTRQKVLKVAEERGLPLVGSTDWHGWTGFTRVWTVFRHDDLTNVSRIDRGKLVINELRNRNSEAFIPVIAGVVGGELLVREILTPFYEWGRYGMELSAQRLLFWWIWAAIFTLLYIKWKKGITRSLIYGLPTFLAAGIALRAYEMNLRAKLYPDDFFIRELPIWLNSAAVLTMVVLLSVYIESRKKVS
jgi:hypothetical protein